MTCAFILALLCVAEPVSVDVEPRNPIFRQAHLRIGEVAVSVTLSADGMAEFPVQGAPIACEGETCLAYRKMCGVEEADYICRYSTANSMHTGWLTLRALNEAALREAEAQLGVLAERGNAETAIALSDFDEILEWPPRR